MPTKTPAGSGPKEPPAPRDLSRWLGDSYLPILDAIGVLFDDFGTEGDERAGWATASFEPTPVACDRKGVVQAGVHAVVLDAAMSFAVNAGLSGKDRAGAALELKTETMRPAVRGELLAVRGAVIAKAKQVVFAEARIEDKKGRLVSRSTGSFLVVRDTNGRSKSANT